MTDPDPRPLLPWLRKADALIGGKLDDAHAHAVKALTDALRGTPDGRPTRARVGVSPSYQAALHRLDELALGLVDLVKAARREFYADAFAAWVPRIPTDYHVSPDPEPTQYNTTRFAACLMHGRTLQDELGTPIKGLRSRLLAALTLAGRRAESDRGAADHLAAWRTQAGGALTRAARTALSDSQVGAITQAGRDVIHPQFIEAD